VVNALILGASGGLASALSQSLLARGWQVDLVTRHLRQDVVAEHFAEALHRCQARLLTVENRYSSLHVEQPHRAYFFTQALFSPKPIIAMQEEEIAAEVEAGLLDILSTTRNLLLQHPPRQDERRDFCFIGSTSAYSGFRNSAVYCAVKHGLLGFVRALNDEYAQTGARFWLFSMGTMDTAMGRKMVEQDPATYLQPADVAVRIVDAISSESNIFESEVILRRRTIRSLEKSTEKQK
jgi:NAD(P)-dependent dehydrogenase (short-subunit alcohol dehydrogenase family)